MMQNNQTEPGVFNAKNIKKYWRNQKPPTNQSSQFTDPYFPPNKNSLLALDNQGNFIDPINGSKKAQELSAQNIEWKRVRQVVPQARLFDSKIEFDDIKQGNLGNCYFLSAIAALTEFPYLIYQIFRTTEENDAGFYEIVLFLDGEWQIVFIDDYLPFENGTDKFFFAKPNGLELWVVLLEKAWAKVNGGYSLTIAGWPSDPLAVLTGFSTEKLTHKEIEIENLFNIILTSDKNNNIMCTSTKNDGSCEKFGLVVNHAYTLIGAKEYVYKGKKIRLIRIRNPWGYKEWAGDWSDASPLWNEELKQVFDQVKGDDGTFYMCIEDFVKFYECTHICHIMYDCFIKSKVFTSKDLSAPQVFNIYLSEDSRTAISLIFRHWRFNRQTIDKNHPATMLIGRYDKNDNIVDVDGVYSSLDSLEYVKVLKKGYYVVWVYACLAASETVPDKVVFRCYSTNAFKFLHCGSDPTFKIAKKIMLEGIKEKDADKYKAETSTYICVENQFKRTGLGYRAIFNKDKEKYHKWEFDATKAENEYILPPFTKKDNFTLIVPPNSMRIVLGLRTLTYGTFWFNLACKYYICSGKCPKEAETENFSPSFLQGFLQEDFIFSNENPLTYYDYHSSSLEISKSAMEFSHIDMNEVNFDKIKSENPNLVNLILAMDPLFTDLNFNKVKYDNGFYVGEFSKDNQRHGRGAYVWAEGTYYVGYWDNGIKEKYGKYFYKDDFMFYEGEFSKGVKNGKGSQYYKDDSKYVGIFVNDKRHGNGLFTWGDGSSWKGPFVEGQFHGTGLYSFPGEEPFEATYENGKLLE